MVPPGPGCGFGFGFGLGVLFPPGPSPPGPVPGDGFTGHPFPLPPLFCANPAVRQSSMDINTNILFISFNFMQTLSLFTLLFLFLSPRRDSRKHRNCVLGPRRSSRERRNAVFLLTGVLGQRRMWMYSD